MGAHQVVELHLVDQPLAVLADHLHGDPWLIQAGFGLLLATSWLLPWYLLWPLPLAAVARDRLLAALLLALTAYQLGARIPL